MLDISGSPIWQYKTLNGDPSLNNLIEYKLINSSTDMVVATSGNGVIYYNRILSSSSSPYSVTANDTYYDPSFDINRQIKAMHITGLLSAFSLIFDSINFWSDLA
jgi:hypothetical protein